MNKIFTKYQIGDVVSYRDRRFRGLKFDVIDGIRQDENGHIFYSTSNGAFIEPHSPKPIDSWIAEEDIEDFYKLSKKEYAVLT